MPIYEFLCEKCLNSHEQLCKLGEPGAELTCPHCGTQGMRRLISSFAAPGVKGGQDRCGSCSGGDCSSC